MRHSPPSPLPVPPAHCALLKSRLCQYRSSLKTLRFCHAINDLGELKYSELVTLDGIRFIGSLAKIVYQRNVGDSPPTNFSLSLSQTHTHTHTHTQRQYVAVNKTTIFHFKERNYSNCMYVSSLQNAFRRIKRKMDVPDDILICSY